MIVLCRTTGWPPLNSFSGLQIFISNLEQTHRYKKLQHYQPTFLD